MIIKKLKNNKRETIEYIIGILTLASVCACMVFLGRVGYLCITTYISLQIDAFERQKQYTENALDIQKAELCQVALLSGKKDYQLRCECYYESGDIDCIK